MATGGMNKPRKRMYSEFMGITKSLLQNGDYSDLKITCGEKEWKVHRSLVCSQSDFFKAAIRFGGKESSEAVIDLPEDDPTIVGYMIEFMYGVEYKISSTRPPVWWVRLDRKKWSCGPDGQPTHLLATSKREAHQILWDFWRRIRAFRDEESALNAMYVVVEVGEDNLEVMRNILSTLSERVKFADRFPPSVIHKDAYIHAQVYAIGEKYNLQGLKDLAAFNFEESIEYMFSGVEFFEAVTLVFTSTPETDTSLRDIVAKHIYEEKTLYGMYKELDENMQTTPGLAYHVWKYEWSLAKA